MFKNVELDDNSILSSLEDFNVEDLEHVMIDFSESSSECVSIDGYEKDIIIEKVYDNINVPLDIIEALCSRTYIPQIDKKRMSNKIKTYKGLDDIFIDSNLVSLKDAIEFVLLNYSFHLQQRSYMDIMSILNVQKVIDSSFKFEKAKIIRFAKVFRSFNKIFKEYKQNMPMIHYVMDLDKYGFCENIRHDTDAIIANIL